MVRNDNDLFYICSLIEFIGRERKQKRKDLVNLLGEKVINIIYTHASVLHCEVIDSVADRFIEIYQIPKGDFDNVSTCKYDVPSYWDIGKVYERLIEDVCEKIDAKNIIKIYNSWISDAISNYNSDFFYQSRDYIKECFFSGEVLVS